MKMKRGYLFILSIFMFVLFTNVIKVNAVMNTGFKTNQLPSEEKNIFISNINILPIDEEPVKKTITCFDVNSNRLIAIGQSKPDRKTICIYSSEGIFQYGYTFNCSGDFGVEWDEDNLNIYFIRSSVIVCVTPNGEILDVVEVQNTVENNSYVNHFIHATERTIDDVKYFIGNNMGLLNLFASSYSQITVEDMDGEKSVIYDVGSAQFSNMVAALIGVLVFISLVVAVVICQFIKLKRGT